MRLNLAESSELQKPIPRCYQIEDEKKPALLAGTIHISGDMEETN
jgi:hypothetical protein